MRSIGRTGHRQIAEIIVVVAELQLLSAGALIQRIKSGRAGKHGIAPADENVGVIAFRHMVIATCAGADVLEIESRHCIGAGFAGRCDRERPDCCGNDRGSECAFENAAPIEASRNDVSDREIVARIAPDVLGRVKSLRTRNLCHDNAASEIVTRMPDSTATPTAHQPFSADGR